MEAGSYADMREKTCEYLLLWLPGEGGREPSRGNTTNLGEIFANKVVWQRGPDDLLLQSLLSVSLVLQSHPRMENKQFLGIT